VSRFEFTNIMVSDQYLHNLFTKLVDSRVLNFKEDDIMTNMIEVVEKPIFPKLEQKQRELASLPPTPSIKEIRGVLASKFSGLKPLTKGKLSNLEKKLKSAHLAIAMDPSKKDNLSLDINSMIEKFYSSKLPNPEELTTNKPPDKFGVSSFNMFQVSPMMQTLLQNDTYKQVKQGKRNLFGVCSNNIVKGKTEEELSRDFEQYPRLTSINKPRKPADPEDDSDTRIKSFLYITKKRAVEKSPWEKIEHMYNEQWTAIIQSQQEQEAARSGTRERKRKREELCAGLLLEEKDRRLHRRLQLSRRRHPRAAGQR